MTSIPRFLLERLYVKKSLRNIPDGFRLTIQNTLAPGTIVGFDPLRIDDMEHSLEHTSAVLGDGRRLTANSVSTESPVLFRVGERVVIEVRGEALSVGPHRITVSARTREVGLLEISATDTID